MLVATAVMYLISAVLGSWSATLLWRLLIERAERRRLLKNPAAPRSISFTPRQRRLGVALVTLCLPGAVGVAATAEWLSSMQFGLSIASITLVAAVALAFMLAVGAACAGWFFDPPRGRRRCPSCWYELPGAPGLCPECGRDSIPARALLRTRRSRPLLALAAVLFLVAGGLGFLRVARSESITVLIPTSVLIAALSWLPDQTVLYNEGALEERLRNSSLSPAQVDAIHAYCSRVISSTTDVARIETMCGFYVSNFNPADPNRPRISQQAAASILAAAASRNYGTSSAAVERLAWLAPFMPTLDASSASTLLPQVQAAIEGADPRARDIAYMIAIHLGPVAEPLSPLARTRYLDSSVRPERRLAALNLLITLASVSDKAWDELIACQTDSSLLVYAVPIDVDALETKLLRALQHPSDVVAGWAASKLHDSAHWPTHAQHVLAVLSARPAAAARFVDALAVASRLPDGADSLILRMLHSKDDAVLAAALRYCFANPHLSAPFLPALRLIRDRTSPNNEGVVRTIQLIELSQRESQQYQSPSPAPAPPGGP